MRQLMSTIFVLLFFGQIHGQNIIFNPEYVVGNRSGAYQHFIRLDLSKKWSLNNLTIFDTGHKGNENNIFFIRNTLAYKINQSYALNAAVGIKNPGAFGTVSVQYQYIKNAFKFQYSVGTTYQDNFSLEQSLSINYSPHLTDTAQFYFNLLMVSNTDLHTLIRGIQQFRIGISKNKLISGVAMNFDQFNNSSKTLSNYGLFVKINF